MLLRRRKVSALEHCLYPPDVSVPIAPALASSCLCPLVGGLAGASSPGVQPAGGEGRVYSLVPSQSILAFIFLTQDVAAFLPVRNTLLFSGWKPDPATDHEAPPWLRRVCSCRPLILFPSSPLPGRALSAGPSACNAPPPPDLLVLLWLLCSCPRSVGPPRRA